MQIASGGLMANDAVLPCDTCGLTQRIDNLEPGTVAECIRCGSPITWRGLGGLDVSLAFTLSALVLYVPANLYPILQMNMYGVYSETAVWVVVVSLWRY